MTLEEWEALKVGDMIICTLGGPITGMPKDGQIFTIGSYFLSYNNHKIFTTTDGYNLGSYEMYERYPLPRLNRLELIEEDDQG